MKHPPYMPISMPELIEVGPHQGKYAIRYLDENGLVQTHFPFISSQIAWAFAVAQNCKHFKVPLTPLNIGSLDVGDLVLDKYYSLIQITSTARLRKNLFNEVAYRAEGIFAKELPNPGIEFLIAEAYQLPLDNEDLFI